MNEPGGPQWPFSGHVTAPGGVAGQAAVEAGVQVVLRFTASGAQLTGEVSGEAWSSGALTFARHFVVSIPLARTGP